MGDGSWLSSSRRFGQPRLQARLASVLRGTINLQRFGGGGGGGWSKLTWVILLGLLDTAESKSASLRRLSWLLLLLFLLRLFFLSFTHYPLLWLSIFYLVVSTLLWLLPPCFYLLEPWPRV